MDFPPLPEGGDLLRSMSVIPYIEDLHSGVPSDEDEYDQDHIFANNGSHAQQHNTQCKYDQDHIFTNNDSHAQQHNTQNK